MTTAPPPPTKHDHPDCHQMIWTQSELVWIQARDAQWMERIASLEAALKKANDQAEHFEREWYLRGDAIEKLEADRKMLREALLAHTNALTYHSRLSAQSQGLVALEKTND